MAKIAGQRMSAETKATRAVVYARGVPVPEPDVNMCEHERFVARPSTNASAIPRGVKGRKEVDERQDAWSMSEAHARAIVAAVVQQQVTRRVRRTSLCATDFEWSLSAWRVSEARRH